MSWPQTGAPHYHLRLGLPDKGSKIEDLVVCYVVWLGSMRRGWVLGQVHRSGPLLWSGWRSSSSTATPNRKVTFLYIVKSLGLIYFND